MALDRLIRLPELLEITGSSKSCIYRWIRDERFPPPVKSGPNSVRWRASLVQEWMDGLEQMGSPASPDERDPQEGESERDTSPEGSGR
ncbi:MAG TPA: AlpA family phage regulatory protein [Thermoanaerobaculia bacterium]|nr:AlpA family phage regulatory protein [Thermoanaerobaculia bacterium]